jgi:hypothetical protein
MQTAHTLWNSPLAEPGTLHGSLGQNPSELPALARTAHRATPLYEYLLCIYKINLNFITVRTGKILHMASLQSATFPPHLNCECKYNFTGHLP